MAAYTLENQTDSVEIPIETLLPGGVELLGHSHRSHASLTWAKIAAAVMRDSEPPIWRESLRTTPSPRPRL